MFLMRFNAFSSKRQAYDLTFTFEQVLAILRLQKISHK